MHKVRVEGGQRHRDEGAGEPVGIGQAQVRLVDHAVIPRDQVQVDGAGTNARDPAEIGLDPAQDLELERARLDGGLHEEDSIPELGVDTPVATPVAERGGAVEGRDRDHPDVVLPDQAFECSGNVNFGLDVGPDRDEGGHGYVSRARSTSTATVRAKRSAPGLSIRTTAR